MNKLFSTKSKYKNEQGFGALEFLLVVVLIVSIGLAGWFVFGSNNQNTPNESNTITEDSRATSSSDQSDQNSLNNETQKEAEYLDIVE